jgi:hypothetical protein
VGIEGTSSEKFALLNYHKVSHSILPWSGDWRPTGAATPNSGSINRSSGLRYGGLVLESEFGPKVWRSGLGTGIYWPEAWKGPGSGAMTVLVRFPYRRAPSTILHRYIHIVQFMTIFLIFMSFANLQ